MRLALPNVRDDGGANWFGALAVGLLTSGLLIVMAVEWGFVLTASSDPLEYVGPALDPTIGFPYPDRLALWLWLRAFAWVPVPVEWIGPIATLAQSVLIAFIGATWIAGRQSVFAGGLFGMLFLSAPIVTGVVTYTYPVQLMTLILMLVGIAQCEIRGKSGDAVAGTLAALAVFSKVQAIGTALLLVGNALAGWQWRRLLLVCLGGLLGAALVLLVVVALDGPAQVVSTFDRFINDGFARRQYVGRATGELPPFNLLFRDPTAVLAMAGAIGAWILGGDRARVFAALAIVQLAFLIAVYVITDRGGALITNYFYDSLVLGLLAVCLIIGNYVRGRLLVALLLPPIGFAAASLGASFGTPAPLNLGNMSPSFSPLVDILQGHLDWLLGIGLLFALAWGRWRLPALSFVTAGSLSIVIFLAVLFAGKGPLQASFDREWSAPYHEVAHAIMDSSASCLETMRSQGPELDAWRVLWLLTELYQWPNVAECGPWSRPEI